jgi:hypothetical protein
MECLAEGIREELDNAVRADTLTDRMAAFTRTASLSKQLRTACNFAIMELRRIDIENK